MICQMSDKEYTSLTLSLKYQELLKAAKVGDLEILWQKSIEVYVRWI